MALWEREKESTFLIFHNLRYLENLHDSQIIFSKNADPGKLLFTFQLKCKLILFLKKLTFMCIALIKIFYTVPLFRDIFTYIQPDNFSNIWNLFQWLNFAWIICCLIIIQLNFLTKRELKKNNQSLSEFDSNV